MSQNPPPVAVHSHLQLQSPQPPKIPPPHHQSCHLQPHPSLHPNLNLFELHLLETTPPRTTPPRTTPPRTTPPRTTPPRTTSPRTTLLELHLPSSNYTSSNTPRIHLLEYTSFNSTLSNQPSQPQHHLSHSHFPHPCSDLNLTLIPMNQISKFPHSARPILHHFHLRLAPRVTHGM